METGKKKGTTLSVTDCDVLPIAISLSVKKTSAE